MAKYQVYGRVSGSIYLGEVEAETEEDAQKKAWELPSCHVSFCHHCSSQCEDPEVADIVAELDEDAK